jgi:hypothetical protein
LSAGRSQAAMPTAIPIAASTSGTFKPHALLAAGRST